MARLCDRFAIIIFQEICMIGHDADMSSPPVKDSGTPSRANSDVTPKAADSDARAKAQVMRLGTDRLLPLLFKLSVPGIVSMVSLTIYSNADVSFIGQYVGNIGLAAVGIFTPFQSLAYLAVCLGFTVGASSLIAPALGMGDYKMANAAFFHFIILGVAYTVLMPVIFLPWLPTLARIIGAAPGLTMEYVLSYGYIAGGLIPFAYFVAISLVCLLVNENRPVETMILQMSSAILNIFIDAILFPLAGWYLHIQAAAIATAVSNIVIGVIVLMNYGGVFKQGILRFTRQKCKDIKAGIFLKIISIGLPQFVIMLTACLCPILANSIIKKLDISLWRPDLSSSEQALLRDYYQGAYGIASRVSLICNMPANGINQGFLAILGFNLGAANYSRVYSIIWIATISIILIMLVLWAIMEGIADYFVLIYVPTHDTEMQRLTGKLVRLSIAGYPIIGFIFIVSGIAQMEHRPWIALLLQCTRAAITILFQYLFPYAIFKGNLESSFYAFMVGDISSNLISIGVLYYYLQKYKRLSSVVALSARSACAGGSELTPSVQATSCFEREPAEPGRETTSPEDTSVHPSVDLGSLSTKELMKVSAV